MLRYLSIGALMLSSAVAMADGPSYSYIGANYQEVDVDLGGGFDVDGDGYGVNGSAEIGESWYVFVDYSTFDFESVVDINSLSVGAGYHSAISEKTDWFGTLGYVDQEVDVSGLGSFSEDGFGASLGVRSMVNPKLELYGAVGYVDLGAGADGTSFAAGLWYTVSGNLALGLGFDTDDDVTGYGVGIRLYFDK